MDNLSRTLEILKGKGLTAEQALMHITALENEVAIIDHELGELHDNFHNLEYSDKAFSQYRKEDVFTLLNIYQNRMQRFLRYMMDIITARQQRQETIQMLITMIDTIITICCILIVIWLFWMLWMIGKGGHDH